ncbi:MAG TPA: porin [Kofleriaceae bacterium]|nr:porin [Kofleriaceae bacterium]
MSRSAVVATAVLAAGILPHLAHAQEAAPERARRSAQGQADEPAAPARAGAQDLKAQVAAIRKQLDELRSTAAQAQTVAGSVQQLSGRVTALEQRIDRLGRQRAAGPELTASVDRLSAQANALERDVEGLRTQVAGIEQPAAGGGVGSVEYKRGFEWTTGDGAYSLKIGGFVQPRYEASLAEEANSVNRSTFRLRRGRLILGGHAGRDELTYKVQLETTVADASALDYYVDYELLPELAVRAGQDKLYFTRAWWASDSTIDVLERPASVEGLRYDRDIGVWAHGELFGDRVYYHAGVSNGAGPNKRNDNIDTATLVRVEAALLGARFDAFVANLTRDPDPRLMIGAGAVHDLVALPPAVAGTPVNNRDVDANGETDNVRVWSASVDAALRWHGLELIAEGIWRHERWGTIVQHADNQALATLIDADSEGHRNYLGGYVHASFPIIPELLQIAARVGHSRVALLGVGGRVVNDAPPPGDRLLEATGQLRYFHGNLTLGGSYSLFNYNNKSGPELAGDIEHVFIVQGQLNF